MEWPFWDKIKFAKAAVFFVIIYCGYRMFFVFVFFIKSKYVPEYFLLLLVSIVKVV